MLKVIWRMLQAVKFEVIGFVNSLASRRSWLLPPLSHKKLRHWYKLLDDEDLASSRRISPEFADFVVRNLGKMALTSNAF